MVKKSKGSKQEIIPKIINKKFALLDGVKDVLPADNWYWKQLKEKIDELVEIYGYEEINMPIIEPASLYQKAWGKNSDLLKEQLYSFKDESNKSVALRPGFISSIARAYIEHGMINKPQPVKVYTYGPVFRYVKPQAALYRQHQRYDCHIVGDDKPISDAELVILGWQFLSELGLPTIVYINSIGCDECKPAFKTAVSQYYRSIKKRLCKDCQQDTFKNPLKLLSCSNENCIALRMDAPQSVDFLCDDCKTHFMKTLEYLDQAEVPYSLNAHFVRDYTMYSRTIFFFINNPEKPKIDQEHLSFNADKVYKSMDPAVLGSGGRFDTLIEKLGGDSASAVHVSFGLERVVLFLKEYSTMKKVERCVELFIAQLGEQAKKKTFPLLKKLRDENFRVQVYFNKHDLKSQLASATRVCAKYTLIMGHKEVLDDTILVRDMESGSQEVVAYNKIVKEMHKRLK